MLKLRRIGAITIKEFQDVLTNKNVLLMFALPVVMLLIYNNLIPDMPEGFALGFGLLFLVAMVGMYVPAMIIAEEKEKGTLEVLMLSPATPAEVFAGKAVVTFSSIIVALFLLLALSGNGTRHLPVLLTAVVLTSVVCILIGMIIGLLAPNQMSTGVIGTPVYMVLMLVPLLAQLGEGFIVTLARLLPTHYFFEMLRKALEDGLGLRNMMFNILVLCASIVLAFLLFLITYKKKGLA